MKASLPTFLPALDSVPPAQLAAELRHLPGLVFLDSSSCEEGGFAGDGSRFSLITARPVSRLQKNSQGQVKKFTLPELARRVHLHPLAGGRRGWVEGLAGHRT